MLEKSILIANCLVVTVFSYVLLHFINNIKDKLTRQFWFVNLLFAGLRTLNSLFIFANIITPSTFKIINVIITIVIFGYFVWFLNRKYGVRFAREGEIDKEIDEINKEMYPYVIKGMDKFINHKTTPLVDIDKVIANCNDNWQALTVTGSIMMRKWKGEMKANAFHAAEVWIKEDTNLPEHIHDYIETIEVLEGKIQLKHNMKPLRKGDIAGIAPFDPHFAKAIKGTKFIAYFTRLQDVRKS